MGAAPCVRTRPDGELLAGRSGGVLAATRGVGGAGVDLVRPGKSGAGGEDASRSWRLGSLARGVRGFWRSVMGCPCLGSARDGVPGKGTGQSIDVSGPAPAAPKIAATAGAEKE